MTRRKARAGIQGPQLGREQNTMNLAEVKRRLLKKRPRSDKEFIQRVKRKALDNLIAKIDKWAEKHGWDAPYTPEATGHITLSEALDYLEKRGAQVTRQQLRKDIEKKKIVAIKGSGKWWVEKEFLGIYVRTKKAKGKKRAKTKAKKSKK